MKNKLIPLILLLILGLSACSASPEEKSVSNIAPSAEDLISEAETANSMQTSEVLEITTGGGTSASSSQYAKYQLNIEDAERILREKITDLSVIEEGYGFSPVLAYSSAEYETLGYLQTDVNGDGIDELLFGENDPNGGTPQDSAWDSIIYNIFTLKNDNVYVVANGWERNRYYLCDNGMIANEGSGGAFYSYWSYYTMDGVSLSVIESVFTDGVDEKTDEVLWYHSNGEPYDKNAVQITEEEAMKIIDAHPIKKINFIPFKREN
ncbi:MAG: hypothetical protein J5898_07235 [Lachnospiraceae bacterium]|nr:hypothetical protein [Lachnospiraceae bacterium]